MKKIISLILVFLIVATPLTFSKSNCENLDELQCRTNNECIPLYNKDFLIFSYGYSGCMEGTPKKVNYINEISGFVSSLLEDFKGKSIITGSAELNAVAKLDKNKGDINAVAELNKNIEEATIYIYAGSKLLAQVKDVQE